MVNDEALQMIENALKHCMRPSKSIENMALYVCPKSKISDIKHIRTRYGQLRVVPGIYIPLGLSYILEDPTGMKGRMYSWVSRYADIKK